VTSAHRVSAGAVVAELRRALDERADRPADPLLGLLFDLQRNNLAQWELEDETRRPDADDAAVAAAKTGIDRLNATRHQLVEELDAAIDRAVSQTPTATPSTESPAMVFDRLSVLLIRIHHTELAARSDRAAPAVYAERLPILYGQLAVLEEALDAFLAEVRAGTRRFVPYRHLKLYAP
jgi:hypothetical protein